MNCHLYFLTEPAEFVDKTDSTPPTPVLNYLLAVGSTQARQEWFEMALCHDFNSGLGNEASLAALAWLGEGNDPADYYWLHADPVHLSLQRDYFVLSYPAPLRLSDAEAESIVVDLNQYFATENLQENLQEKSQEKVQSLQFLLSASGRWYLRLEKTPENRLTSVSMSLLDEAVGRDIRDFQPQGKDAGAWKKILNEIQMLLHEHPVNEAREARGELAMNSLWLSGGGALAGTARAPFSRVFADHPLAKGLALQANLPCYAAPANAQTYLAQAEDNDLLVIDSSQAIDADWFFPLSMALRKRKIHRLTIHLVTNGHLITTRVKPLDLWKFWRKPRLLRADK